MEEDTLKSKAKSLLDEVDLLINQLDDEALKSCTETKAIHLLQKATFIIGDMLFALKGTDNALKCVESMIVSKDENESPEISC